MGTDDQTNPVNPSTLAAANENDGKITLSFLNNNLEVRGDFFPPMGNGSPISPEYIKALLEQFKITHGVNHEEIEKARSDCTSEYRIIRDVLVARGEAPVNEVLEYTQINPYLTQFNTPDSGGSSVDHRVRSPFIIVRKDMALAKQKSRKPGKDGKDIHGQIMAHGTVRPEGVSGGDNTRMEGPLLLSNINGQMVVSGKVVSVRESLVITGPVGYGTGNIIFPGDVEIEGPVSDGFKIHSGGTITIKQTFDVTEAVTKKDLNVAGGIIGRGQAFIKVGGALKTKFIENCQVAVRQSISVDLEIINSKVFTLETLEMGDRGRIVGGEIYAVKGIRAGNIGKKTGKAAQLHCGVDFTLEQEKERNNGILRLLAAKLNRLRELMEDPNLTDEKKVKIETLRLRLEEEQMKTQAKITELLGKINTYANAVVEIKGEIVEGTVIEICQAALFVTTPLKKVRIRLENGKLVTEKL